MKMWREKYDKAELQNICVLLHKQALLTTFKMTNNLPTQGKDSSVAKRVLRLWKLRLSNHILESPSSPRP